ncbi:MAG: FAD:protein FMN transferase [Victivallales bacterium]|nr:FAD:protein FMN transferase [Victivallales bacterium]
MLAAIHFRSDGHDSRSIRFAAFNTVCGVTLYGKATPEQEGVLRDLLALMQRLHDSLNVHSAESELSRLNATAAQAPFHCSDLLWDALRHTRDGVELTRLPEGGFAFDPTIGPLMRLWGFHGKRATVPSQAELTEALSRTGFSRVEWDDDAHTVHFPVTGMALDLGGMAKGYACHLAAQHLEQHGQHCYLLDFGGNIRLSDTPPKGRSAFTVGIRSPGEAGGVLREMDLTGVTVSTSGNYERHRMVGGRKVGHIMHPATGEPCAYLASVTAITEASTLADIFSTAVFVGGPALAQEISRRAPGTRFVIIPEVGEAPIDIP